MTSLTPGRVAQTLGFRLAFWYAAIFTVSVLVIAAIAYALLARSLNQRDHDLIRSSWPTTRRDSRAPVWLASAARSPPSRPRAAKTRCSCGSSGPTPRSC